ncbi:MAG: sigma-E processing peptidase SpoIIGA [Clostridia bacterium]|nr:sigma-E processing peptidase SpoIIGA [Clostridia bacterium]
MTVYIEYVLVDNVVFNVLILLATGGTLRAKRRLVVTVATACFGAVAAIIMSCFSLNSVAALVVKLLIAVLLCLFMQKSLNATAYFKYLAVFLGYTFMFGGAVLGAMGLFGGYHIYNGAIVYDANIPLSVFIVGIVLAVAAVKNIVQSLKKAANGKQHKVKLHALDLYVSGFIDSGNSLTCEGLPVCFVVNRKIKEKLIKDYVRAVISGKSSEYKSIEFLTMGGSSHAIAYRERLTICGKNADIFVAWSMSDIGNISADLVMSNALSPLCN